MLYTILMSVAFLASMGLLGAALSPRLVDTTRINLLLGSACVLVVALIIHRILV